MRPRVAWFLFWHRFGEVLPYITLIGLPAFAVLAWYFGWGGTGGNYPQCGSGPWAWDC